MPETKENTLRVQSAACGHAGQIPSKYTCEGENINPPLEISGLPQNTKSLALIMEDPHAPRGVFDHWLVWNISPTRAIPENSKPGITGENGFGNISYGGPCPPSGSHRYFFKVYALDVNLDVKTDADKQTLLNALKDHVLASGELMAHYQKRK